MANSKDQLASENRRGFLVGLAVSELLLLLLLALLLFLLGKAQIDRERKKLIEEQKILVQSAGGEAVLGALAEALDNYPGVRNALKEDPKSIPVDWVTLTNRAALSNDFAGAQEQLAAQISENEKLKIELAGAIEERNAAKDEAQGLESSMTGLQNDLEKKTEELRDSIAATQDAQKEQDIAKAGVTPLCVYLEAENEFARRGSSMPIGSVLLKDTGLTLLRKGYIDGEVLVDFYGDDFSPETVEQLIGPWEIGEQRTWGEFKSIMSDLNIIGDAFESDEKQKCRHYFSYFFTELDTSFLEDFINIVYSPVKISRSDYQKLLSEVGPFEQVESFESAVSDSLTEQGKSIISFDDSGISTIDIPVISSSSDDDSDIALMNSSVNSSISLLGGSSNENQGKTENLTQLINANTARRLIFKVEPEYPNRAEQRGLEGFCQVSFDIDENGSVVSDSIVIIESRPRTVFDRSCRSAISKFEFEPSIENGKSERVKSTYRFIYNLAD